MRRVRDDDKEVSGHLNVCGVVRHDAFIDVAKKINKKDWILVFIFPPLQT